MLTKFQIVKKLGCLLVPSLALTLAIAMAAPARLPQEAQPPSAGTPTAASSAGAESQTAPSTPQGPSPAPDASQSASPAPSAPPSLTSGTVKTPEGTPVPSATVRLTNTDTKKSWVSWTDESGKFEFPNLPAGHYQLEVTQLGFVRSSSEEQFPSAGNKPVALVLRVATLAELNSQQGGGGARS
jgi:cytoskeletal protein RodZ